jgi:hypothetical protein
MEASLAISPVQAESANKPAKQEITFAISLVRAGDMHKASGLRKTQGKKHRQVKEN